MSNQEKILIYIYRDENKKLLLAMDTLKEDGHYSTDADSFCQFYLDNGYFKTLLESDYNRLIRFLKRLGHEVTIVLPGKKTFN